MLSATGPLPFAGKSAVMQNINLERERFFCIKELTTAPYYGIK
jgi:hypothetical protein